MCLLMASYLIRPRLEPSDFGVWSSLVSCFDLVLTRYVSNIITGLKRNDEVKLIYVKKKVSLADEITFNFRFNY